MRKTLSLAVISLIFIVVHTSLARYMSIGNAIPDIVLIWVVYLAISQGQLIATIAGFGAGVMLDLLSGQDGMLGLSALCKTLSGFLAGYFFNENKTQQTLSTWRFVLIVLVVALLHDAIYFLIFLVGTDIGWARAIALHGIPSALYTTGLGVVPMAILRRKLEYDAGT